MIEFRVSFKCKVCGGNDINVIEVSDIGGKVCLSVMIVKFCSKEVVVVVELEVVFVNGGIEGRIEVNSEGYELVVLDE